MTTIYVIGAGFSMTCGIAGDAGILKELNGLLPRTKTKSANLQTSIEALLEQNFPGQDTATLELFMSTNSALKFFPKVMGTGKNVFAEEEKEIRAALRRYLKDKLTAVDWSKDGQPVLDFVRKIDWSKDSIITFNYDLLIENALDHASIRGPYRILHLHGSLKDRTLAYPTYRKFAYATRRSKLGERWDQAFKLLRKLRPSDRLVFIGYSMPASDLESKGLFNYTDWYNCYNDPRFYGYRIIVIDPNRHALQNYSFFRTPPKQHVFHFANWVAANMPT